LLIPGDVSEEDFDNASGIGTMLEVAKALVRSPTRPKWQKDDFFGNLYGTELTRSE
jgi:hypothetical protein